MKRETAPILFLIALLVGLSVTAPTAMASGQGDGSDQTVHAQEDDNEAAATVTFARRGTIYVGPSASGEALRILARAYALPRLRSACLTCFGVGIIIGPADLRMPWVVERLKVAYEAGHAIGLTNATAARLERLRDLLGHRGSAEAFHGGKPIHLAAVRKALRADGQLNFSSHLLLPREGKIPWRWQRIADRNDVNALSRIFSDTPFLPPAPPDDSPQQNLLLLADSYISHVIATGFQGSQVEIINSVWDARSFLNSADLYYVLQQIGISGPISAGATAITASNSLVEPHAAPTTLQPSPPTTGQTTTVTSGVSESLGGNIGYNQMQGLNATASAGLEISNSTTIVVPELVVQYEGDLDTGETIWQTLILGFNGQTTLTFYNQWIWQVPFTAYTTAQQNVTFASQAILGILTNSVTANLNSVVPLPFGDVFTLQQPVVTGLSSSTVEEGTTFTIQGTGLYPSLVSAVIIGGTAVNSANISNVSDTQIDVVAPFLCVDCAVVVQTTQGTSNHDFTITIF